MKIIKSIGEMEQYRNNASATVGFVPTMGALHEGHLSLVKQAKKYCDIAIASIYVNPAQFAPHEDFASYPKDIERDKKMLEKIGTDILFCPSDAELYPGGKKILDYRNSLMQGLCANSRPTLFPGVVTVVDKLFKIVQPHNAYFGLKDYQQYLIVKKMAADLHHGISVIGCPIVRERDGLAMSSRNRYLSKEERQDAAVLYHSLLLAKESIANGEKVSGKIKQAMENSIRQKSSARIDYIEIVDPETLATIKEIDGKVLIALAVIFGKARLIDNAVVG